MSFSVVIPARYGPTRLPGKPLLDIVGKPMVHRVWERASASGEQDVVIATDDGRIAEAARAFGAEVQRTRPDHPSGTDRLQEVPAGVDTREDLDAVRALLAAAGRTCQARPPGCSWSD